MQDEWLYSILLLEGRYIVVVVVVVVGIQHCYTIMEFLKATTKPNFQEKL